MDIIKKIYKYQKERFPLAILLFTTLSSVLATVAVVGDFVVTIVDILLVFSAAMFFLFHVRVIDESRDAEYDKKYYPDRPVQKGAITLKELFIVDLIGIIFIILIAFVYGKYTLLITLALFIFTTLAWRDFFMPKFFLNKPMLYHIINSPQMILLQIFMFTAFTGSFKITKIMCLLVAIVYMNIFILEVIRKIKRPGLTKEPGDVYSKALGFKGSLYFTLFLTIVAGGFFFWLMYELITKSNSYLIAGFVIIGLFLVNTIGHLIKKSKTTEKLMLLGGVILYVGVNIVIFFTSI